MVALLLWASQSGGCLDTSDTPLTVVACTSLDSTTTIDAMRIALLDSDLQTILDGVYMLEAHDKRRLSTELQAPSNTSWVRVEGLVDGVSQIRFERRIDNPKNLQPVEMPLTQGCYGVACRSGQTCVTGACTIAPGRDENPLCDKGSPP